MAKQKYLVLFRSPPSTKGTAAKAKGGRTGPPSSPDEMQQMFAAYKAWMEKFRHDILDLGDKLKSDGRVVTPDGVANGPFVEAKELVDGYMIVAAESYEGAVEVVRACPASQVPGASLEIRELTGAMM